MENYLKIVCLVQSFQMATSSVIRRIVSKAKQTTRRLITKPWPWYIYFTYKIIESLLLVTVGLTLAIIFMILRFLITGEQ